VRLHRYDERTLFYFPSVATRKLQNYLRMHRKRSGLSQEEIAFLLSCYSGATVSRYEHFGQTPSLEIALAYAVIFQVPIHELFAGMFDDVGEQTAHRILLLAEKLRSSDPPSPKHQRRRSLAEATLERHLLSIEDHE
jgi:transcriptional regulator with XRE-family HTH domain